MIDLPSVASPDSHARALLPELIEIERLVTQGGGDLDARVVAEVMDEGRSFPLHLIALGSRDRDAPVLGLFGGVHGLERIGTQVVLSFLGSLVERLRWDGGLRQQLESVRQLLAAARYHAPALRPAVPLLLLAGAADRLVDPRCSEHIARRWDAEYALHPAAGHDLPLDDGPWVAQQVSAWQARIQ